MAGICGIINGVDDIVKMYEPLLCSNFVELKTEYKDDKAKFSQVALKSINYKKYETDDVLIYVQGTIYNLDEINSIFNMKSGYFSELLYFAHKFLILKEVLNKIDGFYTAFIYDKVLQKVYIFSDRFGMKYLYWYFKDGVFAFGNELKCFLGIDNIANSLDEDLISDIVNCRLSYLIQDKTLFKDIKLIEPSTLLEFDIKTNKIKHYRYWSYSEIKQQNLTYEKAIDKLHDILLSETKRKLESTNSETFGLSLSGGLDSRLCLCLTLECGYKPSYIWTMGEKNSSDVEIAREICKKNQLKFHHMKMSVKHFFKPRINGIWQTDGQMNFVNTHGCEFNPILGEHFSYMISGYAGDAVLGETFKQNPKMLDKRINKDIAEKFYGKDLANRFNDIEDSYYDTPHFEPHIYCNRIRRYTNDGFALCSPYFEYITPLFSNKIIEFIFSIPDKYRANNNLYSDMLLKYYPNFFRDIPWNRDNLPIQGKIFKNNKCNINEIITKIKSLNFLNTKWKNSLIKRIIKFSKYGRYKKGFFNYSKVFTDKSFTENLKYYLNSKDMLCKNYIDNTEYENIIKYLKRKDISKLSINRIYAILTIEIFLRLTNKFKEKRNTH